MKHPIAPPFVDLETEHVGAALRSVLWDLFDENYDPDYIRQMIEELFADIAVVHGYSQNTDGEWWRPA